MINESRQFAYWSLVLDLEMFHFSLVLKDHSHEQTTGSAEVL